MTTLVVTALLQVSVLAAGEQSYADAVRRSDASGRPLVVMLGASWCPACKMMRNSTLPQVAKAGGFRDVEFVYVDVDRQAELTKRLARGSAIPQLIRFEKKNGKWNTKHLIGGHSVRQVAAFVRGEPDEKKPLAAPPLSLGQWTRLFSRP